MTMATTRPRPARPLPQPAVRVAPPTDGESAPWAALLAEPLAAGPYAWVMGEDGALVPVPAGEGDPWAPRRGRWAGRRRR